WSLGDRVFGFQQLNRGGGYGELAAIPQAYLARVPAVLSWAEAGTVPAAGSSAYEGLTVHGSLRPGMRVFINGGAGGVGTYAVQVARALGAEVAATCSAGKAELVRELGATTVIDYNVGDPFRAGQSSYDVVLNLVRGAALGPLRALLRPKGVLVTLTGIPPQIPIAAIQNVVSSRRTKIMFVTNSSATLEALSKLIENGSVRPIVERSYGWSELAEAHRRIESGRVIGKLAVVSPA
ncbi:MAG: zinc-binding alcohol dehydrogenase, partial [Myxococcaceae bacterium]|nr:zinc-binding alcohol dehydrogenase [Myxococcaceae bacterium]